MAGSSNAEKDSFSLRYAAMLAEGSLANMYTHDDYNYDDEVLELPLDRPIFERAGISSGTVAKVRKSKSTESALGSLFPTQHIRLKSPNFDSATGGILDHDSDVVRRVIGHTFVADRLARDLGRVVDGWNGDGSRAPTQGVLRDIQAVAVYFPCGTRMPEVEIDPDDGSVVLRWTNHDFTRSFSLTFAGQGRVTGFLSSEHRAPAWRYPVDKANFIGIANRLNDEIVSALMVR